MIIRLTISCLTRKANTGIAESSQAFFAGENGGQTVMGIPELDLVIAIYAGNYADSPGRQIQQAYVPKYILPAIDK